MRCATMITAVCRVIGFSASRSARSVAKSSAENESSKVKIFGSRMMARAMHRRWRWPPEKFVPPWATGASRPSGFSRMKPSDWAISRAFHILASSALRSPNFRLLATVPVNSRAFCGTVPNSAASSCGSYSRTSWPSTRIWPSVASNMRWARRMIVDLPEPVEPMIARVLPGSSVKLTSSSTGSSAPG